MYCYSKKSSEKVIHFKDCHYVAHSKAINIQTIQNLDKWNKRGYRLCKHCFSLQNRYAKERTALKEYCRKRNYKIHCKNNCVEVNTGRNMWIIVHARNGMSIELYHQNTQIRNSDSKSRIQGFHKQNIYENRILDYVKYIADHDGRGTNPIKKGAKGYKLYKATQKKLAVKNVLDLIDSLGANGHLST